MRFYTSRSLVKENIQAMSSSSDHHDPHRVDTFADMRKTALDPKSAGRGATGASAVVRCLRSLGALSNSL